MHDAKSKVQKPVQAPEWNIEISQPAKLNQENLPGANGIKAYKSLPKESYQEILNLTKRMGAKGTLKLCKVK
jgi:hypothetical protein